MGSTCGIYFSDRLYRTYKEDFVHPEYGKVTPMVTVVEDIEHFKKVGSCLAEIAKEFPCSSEAAEFFKKYIAVEEKPSCHADC